MTESYPPLSQTRAQLDELLHSPNAELHRAIPLAEKIWLDLQDRYDDIDGDDEELELTVDHAEATYNTLERRHNDLTGIGRRVTLRSEACTIKAGRVETKKQRETKVLRRHGLLPVRRPRAPLVLRRLRLRGPRRRGAGRPGHGRTQASRGPPDDDGEPHRQRACVPGRRRREAP